MASFFPPFHLMHLWNVIQLSATVLLNALEPNLWPPLLFFDGFMSPKCFLKPSGYKREKTWTNPIKRLYTCSDKRQEATGEHKETDGRRGRGIKPILNLTQLTLTSLTTQHNPRILIGSSCQVCVEIHWDERRGETLLEDERGSERVMLAGEPSHI